jgi:hypothetical protein
MGALVLLVVVFSSIAFLVFWVLAWLILCVEV